MQTELEKFRALIAAREALMQQYLLPLIRENKEKARGVR